MHGVKCPYCGGEMKHRAEKVVDWGEVYRHNLKCKCGATSPYADNLINAVKVAMLRPPQKPLTIDEMATAGAVWLEDNDKETLLAALVGHIVDHEIYFHGRHNNIIASLDEYGTRWRAWASKPTYEERKAAPWEV